jgi:hypothetical protein
MPRTTDRYEKEERSVQDMIKPAPKRRAPRYDLHKHRIKTEDPDTTKDKDMSLNYKDVGGSLHSLVVDLDKFVTRLSFLDKDSSLNIQNILSRYASFQLRRIAASIER